MNDKNSRVISFRLDPKLDDERRALEIFAQWKEQGMDLRQAVVYAVLRSDGQQPSQRPEERLLAELRAALKDSQALATMLRSVGVAPIQIPPDPVAVRDEQPPLDDLRRIQIKKAFQPGLRLPK